MSTTKRHTPVPETSLRSLRKRLEEAEETIRAIRDGEVDAFVMRAAELDRVVPLEPATHPYRMLVERMQQAALTVGSDEEIVYCNKRFAELIGKTATAIYAERFPALLHLSSRPVWHALRRQALEGGISQEELILASDAGPVPVLASVSAFGKDPVGLSVMLTDLTAQKRHERVVAEEALSRSILEQAADAIVVCDETGRVIRASRTACDLASRNPILLPFEAGFPLFVEEEGELRFVRLAPILGGQTRPPTEVRMRRADETVDLLFRAAPLVREGMAIGSVVTLTDIRDRKRTEEALRDADRRKDEFLAVLGHELRNALGPVRNAARLLERLEAEGRSGKSAREMIERQASHMARIIGDLLDVARIAQGDIALEPRIIDLADLVRSTAEDRRPQFAAAEVELDVRVPEEPLPVSGDTTRLAQALGNILDNAVKFTPAGGRAVVTAAAEGNDAVVRVRDTGIGMDEEVLSRVFDRFSQSRAARQRSRGGLGLGMAVARGIVRLHGGELQAESEGPQRGSEFTIRLPRNAVLPVGDLPPKREAATERTCRILIVEDNPDMAESLRMLLEMSGHEVRNASDGLTGLEIARHFRPEIVLCDLGLPGEMDGLAVAAALRQDPATASSRLVALSGYAGGEDQRRAIEAGFDLHVSKPVSFERLEQILSALRR